jgi:hypothetical protein
MTLRDVRRRHATNEGALGHARVLGVQRIDPVQMHDDIAYLLATLDAIAAVTEIHAADVNGPAWSMFARIHTLATVGRE